MHPTTKIWLIAAAVLVVLGLALFVVVMQINRWDFSKLSTVNYETHTYEITEQFSSISIQSDTADIRFVPAEDGKCTVVCYEQNKVNHCVQVQDDTLTIRVEDSRQWYEYIGINFTTPKITVYLPQDTYTSLFISECTGDIEIPNDFLFEDAQISLRTGDVYSSAATSDFLKIKASTGDIRVENTSAGAMDLSVTTGDITISQVSCRDDIRIHVTTGKTALTDLSCKNLTSDGSTGDIYLQRTTAEESFHITRTTGDVRFDKADAGEIYVKASTGDVTGSLLSEKVFLTHTSTGDIHVPPTVTGGKCEIRTTTGDIEITIA